MDTEDVTLDFTEEGIDALADTAAEINSSVENIADLPYDAIALMMAEV